MNNEWNEVLQQALSYDTPMVAWSGTYYDTDNNYLKLTSVYLNILDKVDGVPRFRRLPGYRAKDKERKLYVLFGDEVVYRVTSGNRQGQLVHLSEIYPTEQCIPACAIKKLEQGDAVDQFNPRRRTDKDILRVLAQTGTVKKVACIEETFPDVFITCNPGSEVLHVRQYGQALRYLESLPGYDKRLLPDENAKRLLDKIGVPAGGGRRAYPFEMFRGKGVLAVAAISKTMAFGQWYAVPRLRGHMPHMEVVA